MLGISLGEILIISAIGLVVVGPKRLPETARFLGHLFNRIQRQVNTVKSDIRREMALEDMKSIHRDYTETARGVQNAFDQAARGVPPPETLLQGSGSGNSSPDDPPAAAQADTNRHNTPPADAAKKTDTGTA